MKKAIFIGLILILLILSTISFAFRIYIGQDKAEIVAVIGKPNYSDVRVDQDGRIERCQWGSERVGGMVVIYFKNDRVILFETKGNVN